MANRPKKIREAMADKYAKARLEGKSKEKSKALAGYSYGTKVQDIEKPGSPAARRIIEELDKRKMDESWLADRYQKAISVAENGKDLQDTMGIAKLLLQVGYLRGHGAKSPAVAVQINNGVAAGDPALNDPERLGEAVAELKTTLNDTRELLRAVGHQISVFKSAGVHSEGDEAGADDAGSTELRPGVVEVTPESPEHSDRGEP